MYSIGNQGTGKIMRKLLGKNAAESPHETTTSATGVTSSPLAAVNYRPIATQDATYKSRAPISCVAQSPDGKSAVLAGHFILKTVTFDGLNIKEGVDLRALLVAQPARRNNAPTSVADQLSIQDVKWGEVLGRQVIFTACTSGKIFQYEVARAASTIPGNALEFIQMREDSRQVNSLDLNPHHPSWLLSGSQDGLLRCFDVRMPIQTRTGATFRALQSFKCNADGVRQVQWCPKDGFLFACGTEQGMVLKWDMRKPSAPILRIHAQEKTCVAIAWHQDGAHLVSAGLDSKCHVWDLSKQDKRQKPKWTLTTPAPVGSLAWRPGQWSATAQGKRASQLAVSYDETSQKRFGINSVHIWDLARPTLPYKEIQRFEAAPSSILWHDQYLLWTAGQDGLFTQCDLSFAPKVIDRQTVSTMAFSALGEVAMCLDERQGASRPGPPKANKEAKGSSGARSLSTSPTAARLSVSRSDSEDDAVGAFLGSRRRSSRKRRPSMMSSNLSTTPPAGPSMSETLSLEDTIKATGTYKPQQSFAIGSAPNSSNPLVEIYLSTNYFEALYAEIPYFEDAKPMPERIAAVLEHYAKAAENVKMFRLAQTWRMLAFGVDLLLKRRAQYHLELRMKKYQDTTLKKKIDKKAKALVLSQLYENTEFGLESGEATPRKITSLASIDRALHPRSLLSEELESTSNVPTPIARPVPDSGMAYLDDSGRKKLTPILEPESFTLPAALHPQSMEMRKRLNSVPLSVTSHDSDMTHASTEGYDFYDTEAISQAIDVPGGRPKLAKVIDFREPGSPSRVRKPPPVLRHNSDDSFTRLFSVSDDGKQVPTFALSGTTENTQGAFAAVGRHDSISEDGEYASRIRGKQIKDSPTRPGIIRQILQRTETDMTSYTAFTDEHHAITQTTDSFDSVYPSHNEGAFQESPEQQQPLPTERSSGPEDDLTPHIIETDYLYWPNDPPYPHPVLPSSQFPTNNITPIDPYEMIERSLQYEVKSSSLNASAIVLLLKPLLPDGIIDSFQAAAIVKQHHDRLMTLRAFIEAALMRKMCMKGWPGGVLSNWSEDYPRLFMPAQQGVQVGLMCPNCKRPREIDRSADSDETIWVCKRCDAVMEPCAICLERDFPPPEMRGDSAAEGKGKSKTGSAPEPVLATWWYCPGCGHGGHSSCMQTWHVGFEFECNSTDRDVIPEFTSDGYCPMDGCGHVCLPGKGAVEAAAARAEEISRAVKEATRTAQASMKAAAEGEYMTAFAGHGKHSGSSHHSHHHGSGGHRSNTSARMVDHDGYGHGHGHGHVRSDGHDVPQTRAVDSVRDLLFAGDHHSGGGSSGGGRHIPHGGAPPGVSILSSSPGRTVTSGDRERRKSVKFQVIPEDTKR